MRSGTFPKSLKTVYTYNQSTKRSLNVSIHFTHMWVQPRVLVYITQPRMMNNLDLYQEYELRMLMSLLRTCMIAEALKVCEVALDIRGTFGRFWWRGLLTNLHSIGIRGRGSAAIKTTVQMTVSLLSLMIHLTSVKLAQVSKRNTNTGIITF